MRRRGFSLIELAMVLGISGLMMGFVLQSKQEGASFDCTLSTKTQLRDINTAIERFARSNSRLPMPAARNIGVEAVTFGREASGAAIDTAGSTSWGHCRFKRSALHRAMPAIAGAINSPMSSPLRSPPARLQAATSISG